MTEEVGFDRADAEERFAQIVKAVAFAIDPTALNEDLPEGIDWRFDETGPSGKPGRITIEGYRDRHMDDGVLIVMQIKHIDFGPHRLTYEDEADVEIRRHGA